MLGYWEHLVREFAMADRATPSRQSTGRKAWAPPVLQKASVRDVTRVGNPSKQAPGNDMEGMDSSDMGS
jgi:hypothetical protein